MNTPNKNNAGSILFAWNDTKPYRREDSQLIVLLNDRDKVGKGVEEAFLNYDANVIKWSERDKDENIKLLSA